MIKKTLLFLFLIVTILYSSYIIIDNTNNSVETAKDIININKETIKLLQQMQNETCCYEGDVYFVKTFSYALPREAIELLYFTDGMNWDNKWHNINTDINNILYIDGVKTEYVYIGNLNESWIRFGDNGFYVNGKKNGSDNEYSGTISEIKLYNKTYTNDRRGHVQIYTFQIPPYAMGLLSKTEHLDIDWNKWHKIDIDDNNNLFIDGENTSIKYTPPNSDCWVRFGGDRYIEMCY